MIRQQIILDKKTARLLRQAAKRDKKTMSQVVRESINWHLSQPPNSKNLKADKI